MNAKLLLAALLCGAASLTTRAQTISFETTEGYTNGALPGQNGWIGNTQGTHAVVLSGTASDGTKSLGFVAQDTEPDGIITAAKELTINGNNFSISQDIYTNAVDDEDGSDFYIVFDNVTGLITEETIPAAIIYFDFEGGIYAGTEYFPEDQDFEDEQVGEFEGGTWYTITATFNLVAQTVTYFIDDQEVYTGPLMKPVTQIKQVAYGFDDFATSFYADKIGINTALDVKQNKAADFSVLPNPAVNEVSIANTKNTLIGSVTVTDINGRTVKSVAVNGLAETTINIADLAPGVYMFRIAAEGGVTTKKVIKK